MPVRFTSNGPELAAVLLRRATDSRFATAAALRAWSLQVKTRAEQLSQGPISTAELSQYKPGLYSAARTGNPAFDAVINRQTGLFASRWRTVPPLFFFTEQSAEIYNDAPYAAFMRGTKKMRKRPILERAIQECPEPAVMVRAAMRESFAVGTSTVGAMNLLGAIASIGYVYGRAIIDL